MSSSGESTTAYEEFRRRTDPPPWGLGKDDEEPDRRLTADELRARGYVNDALLREREEPRDPRDYIRSISERRF